jgi:hypothetical protein
MAVYDPYGNGANRSYACRPRSQPVVCFYDLDSKRKSEGNARTVSKGESASLREAVGKVLIDYKSRFTIRADHFLSYAVKASSRSSTGGEGPQTGII